MPGFQPLRICQTQFKKTTMIRFVAFLITSLPLVATAQPALGILAEPVKNMEGLTCDWPEIVMADDLDAAAQAKVIRSIGRDFEDFTRDSINAPIDIEKSKKSVDGGAYRIYSYYFTARASLQDVSNENLLKKLFADKDKGQELQTIGDDRYNYAEENAMLKRVNLFLVLRSNEGKSEKSIYGGSLVVPEGQADEATFTSAWSSVDSPDDKVPYLGMGLYTKATPLEAVDDCLFFEAHLVFYEPQEWFRGKNLLGAKLPIMIQDQVRSLRRELKK